MGAVPKKGKTADAGYYQPLSPDYVPPGTVVPATDPESSTMLIVGVVAAVALVGGAVYLLTR